MKKILITCALAVSFCTTQAQVLSDLFDKDKTRTTLQDSLDNRSKQTIKLLWNKAFGENADLRIGLGLRMLPTAKGVANFLYEDASPSRDSLRGSFTLGGLKMPIFYEVGRQSKKIPWLGIGIEGYFGGKTTAILGYIEAAKNLSSEDSKNPLHVALRLSYGAARVNMGKVPRNGSYYVINQNQYYSNQDLTMRYLDNVFSISPQIVKYVSFGNKDRKFYLKAAANLSFKVNPQIELSGMDLNFESFTERVKLNDNSVTFSWDGGEPKKNVPIYYHGISIAAGFMF